MNFTVTRLSETTVSRSDLPGVSIPMDPGNRHYAEVLSEGVTVPDYVVPPAFSTPTEALTAMQAWIERAEETIDGGVSKGERDSYLAKELEARAWLADNTSPTPILSAEAAVTQEALADLATKVITKADALRPILGEIAGLRRATEVALLAETDPYQLEVILQGAIAQAITLAAARGITLTP